MAVNRLLRATGNWVNSRGGNALVAGSVGIMDAEPGFPLNFYVVIKVTGKRPEMPPAEKAA